MKTKALPLQKLFIQISPLFTTIDFCFSLVGAMECFAYNQLHQIAFCLHLWHPYKNMYMLCRQPITLSVDALFLADFTKKYSKTKPYVALYPLKAVITRPADIMAVIKTLVNAPGISNVVILWKNLISG
jgi:hypothetical protein